MINVAELRNRLHSQRASVYVDLIDARRAGRPARRLQEREAAILADLQTVEVVIACLEEAERAEDCGDLIAAETFRDRAGALCRGLKGDAQ